MEQVRQKTLQNTRASQLSSERQWKHIEACNGPQMQGASDAELEPMYLVIIYNILDLW